MIAQKIIRTFVLLLFCGFVCLSPFVVQAAQKIPPLFEAETFTLDNGMQVVVIPNNRAPVVSHMVWYKVGAADEPQGDGVSGVAHYLEHLMFKGTKRIPAGQFSQIIRNLGGEDNAFTSWDFTAYFQSISSQHLPLLMALEADRMINIDPPQQDIQSELQVVIEERKQRTDNDPKSLFMEQMLAVFYPNSAYGIPIIGWKGEMKNLTWDQAQHYYQTWYAPNNAILVVSGDTNVGEVKSLAQKYFGILPPKKIPNHTRPTPPRFISPISMSLSHPDVQQDVWLRLIRAPSYLENKDQSLALQIAQDILTGNAASKLYQSLVVEQKLASSVDVSYDGDGRASTGGAGEIWLSAVPVEGVSLQQIEDAFEKTLAAIIDKKITDQDIKDAKKRLIDQAIYAQDSVMGPAMIIGKALAVGHTLDDVKYWPQNISSVSPDAVRDVLKTYLYPDREFYPPVTGTLKAPAP
jgi:zinc protease